MKLWKFQTWLPVSLRKISFRNQFAVSCRSKWGFPSKRMTGNLFRKLIIQIETEKQRIASIVQASINSGMCDVWRQQNIKSENNWQKGDTCHAPPQTEGNYPTAEWLAVWLTIWIIERFFNQKSIWLLEIRLAQTVNRFRLHGRFSSRIVINNSWQLWVAILWIYRIIVSFYLSLSNSVQFVHQTKKNFILLILVVFFFAFFVLNFFGTNTNIIDFFQLNLIP